MSAISQRPGQVSQYEVRAPGAVAEGRFATSGRSTFVFGAVVVSAAPSPHPERFEVAREGLNAALDARDFAGIQLGHERGLIDDEDFRELSARYLAVREWTDEGLLAAARVLQGLLDRPIDGDTISTIFRCDFDQAQRVLHAIHAEDHEQVESEDGLSG